MGKNTKKNNSLSLILLNIFVIYLVFTIAPSKDSRYILPVFIFLSAIIAERLSEFKIKNAHIMNYIIIIGLLQVFAYNSGFLKNDLTLAGIHIFSSGGRISTDSGIDIENGLNAIGKQNNFSLCIVAESGQLNDVNVPYFAFKNNYPVRYMIGNGCNPLQFDYVLEGPIEKTWRAGQFEKSKSILNANTGKFELIYSESSLKVYRNKYR